MEKKVRAALIGLGAMGKKYAKILIDGEVSNMELTAVVARKPEAREWIANAGGQVAVYKDAQELYAHADGYDCVIIATPHKTHKELMLQAAALHKHVLCDKPAGISVQEAQDMADAAQQEQILYGVMFHQHKYEKYQKMKELITSGSIGEIKRILLVNSRYLRTKYYHTSGSWRSSWKGEGGGALINQGAHILDMWQWLFGMPDSLYADIPFGKYNDFAVDDEATIVMHYANGCTGTFILSTGEALHEERLEVIGSKGKLLLEDDTLTVWTLQQDIDAYIQTQQTNSRENLKFESEQVVFEKKPEPYQEMLSEYAQAVIEGKTQVETSSGEEAVNQIALTNAAYLSAWKGMKISLPLDASEYEKYLALAEEREVQ